MKISLNWISDYVDWKSQVANVDELAQKLTKAGFEVEGIEDQSEMFKNVVVGHILEKGVHPNADKLSLCQVTTGAGVVHQIVCGAKNHKGGDRVVVALPGAVLPGDFAIKQAKIRGVESSGMLCSEKELGLSTESEGIMILPEDAPIGTPFSKYFEKDDTLLEINITSNRSDCLSHFGMAREVAAVLKVPFEFPLETINVSPESSQKVIQLDVKNSELCPRFTGAVVKGIKVAESPTWLKNRVESVGMNSINNIVDITNYVMLELGQPLHAYDIENIKGHKIVVDTAKAGDKFVTLDGTELELKGGELTIRDAERAVGIAGVIGGKNSGISDSTQDIFVESAHFKAEQVRRTSKSLGVETDSAYRFSRGTDTDGVLLALNRACQLIQEVAGGVVFSHPHDFYPQPKSKPTVNVNVIDVSERLGFSCDEKEFQELMESLGCSVTERGGGSFDVIPPTYRQDLGIKEDFVEEFGRLKGYENIPDGDAFVARTPKSHENRYTLTKRVRRSVASLGFNQSLNYGFTDSKFETEFLGSKDLLRAQGLTVAEEPVKIVNPLSDELNVMRSSLSPGLFRNLSRNFHRGNEIGKLFEVGYSYKKEKEGEYSEEHRLGLISWGEAESVWGKSKTPIALNLKSEIEEVLKTLSITSFKWQSDKGSPDFTHPGQSATLFCEGQLVGFVGAIHPQVLADEKIRVPAAIAELNLDRLLRGQPRLPKIGVFSNFPVVKRDLALVVTNNVSHQDLETTIRNAAGAKLRTLELFDIYQGPGIDPDSKSLAYRMTYQSLEGTLTDQEIQSYQDQIIADVQKKHNGKVR